MKLFCYALAPYSKKVLLVAHERGVTTESEDVPPWDKAAMAKLRQQTTELATVPLLVRDDGTFVTESSAIAEWFDLVGSVGPRVIPPDERAAFDVREYDRLADTLFASVVFLTWAVKKPAEQQNQPKIASMRERLTLVLDEIERRCGRCRSRQLVGDSFTLADASVSAAVQTALYDRTLTTLERWPLVAQWYERTVARPSWEKVIAKTKTLRTPD